MQATKFLVALTLIFGQAYEKMMRVEPTKFLVGTTNNEFETVENFFPSFYSLDLHEYHLI